MHIHGRLMNTSSMLTTPRNQSVRATIATSNQNERNSPTRGYYCDMHDMRYDRYDNSLQPERK
jgi:hypothetical protein